MIYYFHLESYRKVRPHLGVMGYGIFEGKIIGIRDTDGKNDKDAGYL